jgi:hypothetical protein
VSGYLHFDETGCPEIDAILGALTHAGNAYHHTMDWSDDDDGLSERDRIQARSSWTITREEASVDSWSLTVEIPPTVTIRRKRKGRRVYVETSAFPAIHNLRDWALRNELTQLHKAKLDAGLMAEPKLRYGALDLRGHHHLGHRFDVMLIRRAPRPLDSAIQHGEWGKGGRMIYGDNAGSALKAGRDWAAKRVFGLTGDSSPLLRWHVGQEKSARPKLYQLAILIRPAPAEIARCCELPVRWLMGEL